MKNNIKNIAFVLATLTLVSCTQEFKRSIGIYRDTPDEYSVLKNPPLSVPPNFELVPPTEETAVADEKVKTTKNLDVVTQKPDDSLPFSHTSKNTSVSEGDKSFINKFDQHEKRSDIRDILNKKEDSLKSEDKTEAIVPDTKKEQEVKKKKSTLLGTISSWF